MTDKRLTLAKKLGGVRIELDEIRVHLSQTVSCLDFLVHSLIDDYQTETGDKGTAIK